MISRSTKRRSKRRTRRPPAFVVRGVPQPLRRASSRSLMSASSATASLLVGEPLGQLVGIPVHVLVFQVLIPGLVCDVVEVAIVGENGPFAVFCRANTPACASSALSACSASHSMASSVMPCSPPSP